jgi:hypothetical protein
MREGINDPVLEVLKNIEKQLIVINEILNDIKKNKKEGEK